MAKHVEHQNGIEMQCAGAATQAEEHKNKNREIIFIDEIHILLG